MPNPFNLIVLTMETRSFNHMLGHRKNATYPIEGLGGEETTNSAVDEGPPIRMSPSARSIRSGRSRNDRRAD
jgi:hypothetical protein